MSNNTFLILKNNKAQYYPRPSYAFVHPVLILGIIIFVIPFLLPIIHVKLQSSTNTFISTVGVVVILIGGAMSIFKASN